MVIVYLDSNIWLSYFYSSDSNHSKAVQEIQKIENGVYTVIISKHVLNEILDRLKRSFVIKGQIRSSPSHLRAKNLENLVKETFKKLSMKIFSLTNVRFKEPTAEIPMNKTFDILWQYFGTVYEKNRCPICRNRYQYIGYDGFYEADALHVALAHSLNCEVFKTFDKDFKVLENEQIISPLNIEVIP